MAALQTTHKTKQNNTQTTGRFPISTAKAWPPGTLEQGSSSPFSLTSGQAQPSPWHQGEIGTDVHACPDWGAVSGSHLGGVELEAYYDFLKKAPKFAPLGNIHKGVLWTPSFFPWKGILSSLRSQLKEGIHSLAGLGVSLL